jgi:hypothetical protein
MTGFCQQRSDPYDCRGRRDDDVGEVGHGHRRGTSAGTGPRRSVSGTRWPGYEIRVDSAYRHMGGGPTAQFRGAAVSTCQELRTPAWGVIGTRPRKA